MADLNKTFDLNDSVETQTIKLTQDSNNKIIFSNDIKDQIEYKVQNGKIALVIHEVEGITHSYTKTVEKYELTGDSKYKVTSTKYTLSKNGNDYVWTPSGAATTYIADSKPVMVDVETKPYWVQYRRVSCVDGFYANSSKSSAASTADAKDELYYEQVVKNYGLSSPTISEKIKATIYVEKGDIASSLSLTTTSGVVNLLTAKFTPELKNNKYVGSYLNETVTSSGSNEIFDLKTGNDEIGLAFDYGLKDLGKDTIYLAKDENLTLKMLQTTSNITDTASDNSDIYIDTDYKKKGNDLVMMFHDGDGKSLGQTTIKNYFKIAQDNITIKYSGSNDNVFDYEYSLRDILEYTYGIGVIGDEDYKKAQKITGNFLDNFLLGGEGNDTIKCVSGDNIVCAGEGSDKIYSGKDVDTFFVFKGDAADKGDFVYNTKKTDSLYMYDELGAEFSDFTLSKNGNSLVVNSNSDKVTFVDYFKKNSEILNINDKNLADAVISQEGKKNKANKFTDTAYTDNIKGGDKNDKYSFINGGADTVIDEKGNDTYNVKSLSNALTITDNAGKDKLIVSDKDAYSLYFDITIDGSKNLLNVGKQLHIYKENTHANGVVINDYIAKTDEGVVKGVGCIESIKIGGKAVNIDVSAVASSVASWLGDKGYTSTADVFTDHTGDIEAMLKIYTTGEYKQA